MTDSCKHVLKIKTSIQLGILSPDKWHCHVCNTTESVWACLSCPNFACGRYIAEHALQHFRTTGHPLCIEVNEKFVFCYICDDFVLNDNAPGDIKLLRMALDAVTAQNFRELSKQKRGRRILRFHIRDVKRITKRLLKADDVQTAVMRHRVSRLSWALHHWWSHYLDRKRALGASARMRATANKPRSPLTFSPAFTGLRNLGNTCYMNSVLQVLRHTAPFANFVMSHPPSEVLLASKKRRSGNLPHLETSGTPAPCFTSTTLLSPSRIPILQQVPSVNNSPVCPTADLAPPQLHNSLSTLPHLPGNPDLKTADPTTPSDTVGGLNGGRCGHSGIEKCQKAISAPPVSLELTNPEHSSVYEALYNILRTLWSSQRAVVSPSNFLYTVWTALPSFKGYRQQDAQEFLSIFLERLQLEIHGDSAVVPTNARDFVSRTFQGHCVSHIRCSNCNLVACTEEPFTELSLALPPDCYNGNAMECNLMDLLHQFVSPTPIDGKGYACRECSNKREISGFNSGRSNVSFASSHSSQDSFQRGSRSSTPYKDSASNLPLNSDVFGTSSAIGSRATSKTTSPHPTEGIVSSAYCEEASHKFNSPLRDPIVSVSFLNESTCSSHHGCDSKRSTGPCLTSATQTIRLSRLPRVLRLHIKRFRWIGRQREKVGCHVVFPLILDLSEFVLNDADRLECSRTHMCDDVVSGSGVHCLPADASTNTSFADDLAPPSPSKRRYLYHLTGVIVHHGRGFQSGHYTAYCLNDQPECWLNCNDANVSLCDFSEVAGSQAYLLFYSELMPTSPYPSWLSEPKIAASPASLKRCHSAAFANQPTTKPDGLTISTSELTVRHQHSLRRAASTPSSASPGSTNQSSAPDLSLNSSGTEPSLMTLSRLRRRPRSSLKPDSGRFSSLSDT
ncbi:unnamed protein product [Dicrocoelium dendriticum]|nr:unnamed protein product [Dicrocoelium dendriticum]